MITLKQLHHALAVSETRHFKHAAEQCFVSQSALSSSIAELERQLGLPLFERDNKKVLVTPFGQSILKRAAQVVNEVQDIEALAKNQQSPLSQPFSMGVIPTIAPYLLPQVLPSLRADYPKLELTIVEEQSAVLVDAVKKGQLDTAIIALPYDLDGLLSFDFWQEDFYALSHQDTPLAALSSVDRHQLESVQLLLLKEGHCLSDHALSVCQLPRPAQDKGVAGTSLFTLVQMVAGKMGTTLVPEMALESFLSANTELHAQHIDEPSPHRRIAFIVRPNFPGIANIELMKSLFAKALSES
jgi:LysR family hydrogen peroxide-inducible transcriptional activator